MKEVEFILHDQLEPFVNCIMTQENHALNSHTNIPLYADGYPGIMFQQSANGFYFLPKKKQLSELLLYGQTVKPASLDVEGPYKFIVFQLYPFASKYLLGIEPKELNDDCYDLLNIQHIEVERYRRQLINSDNLEQQIRIISDLVLQLIKSNKEMENDSVQEAIAIIIEHKGQIKVKDLLSQLYMTERTFERSFMAHVGLTAKQFAKIIQFQYSIHNLTQTKFNKLVEVGIDSGFSDQSHFIRTFKKYTGQTPRYFLKQILDNQ